MKRNEIDPVEDSDNIVLPSKTPPSITPLDADKREHVWDLGRMEKQLDLYESSAKELRDLHKEWLEDYVGWRGRFDKVYNKVSSLDDSITFIRGQQPGGNFQPFEIFSVHSGIIALFTVVQGGYGFYKSLSALRAARDAENVVQATRWARLGLVTSTLSFAFGGYMAYRTVKDRTDFLIQTLPQMHTWYTDTTNQINTMKSAVEDTILPQLRDIAEIVGASNPDDNIMYRNLIATLNQAITDAAEVEAQYKVATRMLCLLPTPYSVADTAAATGLSDTVVQARKDEIFETSESEASLCQPYRNSGS